MGWKAEHVRAFLDRDWEAFSRTPRSLTPEQSIALADDLYEQARSAAPGWPTADDRDADLAAHTRLSRLFSRIFDVQRRRSTR